MILSPDDRRYLEVFEMALETEPDGEIDSREAGKRARIDPHGAARALRLANWGFLKKRPNKPLFRITYAGIVALHPWREKKSVIIAAVAGWIIAVPAAALAVYAVVRWLRR
jgi:hypothetical protein